MKKKTLFSLLLRCGICLILSALCLLLRGRLSNRLPGQKTAERWQGDSETAYTQYSCFWNASDGLTLDSIYDFREKLDQKLLEAELYSPYRDAWSAIGEVTVSCERESVKATVVAVGGSYFDFHSLPLCSGCTLRENDLNTDLVVLDENLAWLLYGSNDLQGMAVTIGDTPYVVSGVVEREHDTATETFQADTPVIYISWDAWQAMGNSRLTCYEIVLPEPVEGFGEQLLKDNLSIGSGLLQKNAGRYDFRASLALIRNFGTRSAVTGAFSLPWWENAARYYEDWCALLLFAALLLLILPALCAAGAFVFGWVRLRNLLRRGLPRLWRSVGDGLYALSGKLTEKFRKNNE